MSTDRELHSIGVFHDVEPGSMEWTGIISRVARLEGRPFDAVIAAINAMEGP